MKAHKFLKQYKKFNRKYKHITFSIKLSGHYFEKISRYTLKFHIYYKY